MIPIPMRSMILTTILISPTLLAGDDTAFTCEPPTLLSAIYGLENPHSFTIHEDHAYLAHDNKLAIIDLSDPANPQLITDNQLYLNTAQARGISVHRDAVYIGGAIVNIEHPEDPWYMRSHGAGSSVFINDLVYASGITSYEREFCPAFLASSNFPEYNEYAMTVIDGQLVTTHLGRYDITDPLNPVPANMDEYINFTEDRDKTIKDNFPHFLFTPDQDTDTLAVHSYDEITDTFTTRELSSLQVYDASIRGNLIFSTDGSLSVHTLEDEPRLIAHETAGPGIESAMFIRQIDDYFIIVGDGSIGIYDIPTNPIATADAPGHTNHARTMGNLVITSTTNLDTPQQSASVIDITDPRNPVLAALLPIDEPFGIATHAGLAYVAAKRDGLVAFDLSDPRQPTVAATYNTSTNQSGVSNTRDIFFTPNHAYAADRNAGITIYDINPDNTLTPTAQLQIPQAAQRIRVQNNLAFISGLATLYIADVSDPTSPAILSEIPEPLGTDPYTLTAYLSDGLLYTADADTGYRIFDLADPSAPMLIDQRPPIVNTNQGMFTGAVFDFLFRDNLMYVALSSAGFAIYDNTDPLNPTLLRHVPASFANNMYTSRFREFSITRGSLVTAAGFQGIHIYDLNDCSCPLDLNNDGVLNFFDVSIFIEAFLNNDPIADLNHDSNHNFFDIAAFIAEYNTGCP